MVILNFSGTHFLIIKLFKKDSFGIAKFHPYVCDNFDVRQYTITVRRLIFRFRELAKFVSFIPAQAQWRRWDMGRIHVAMYLGF